MTRDGDEAVTLQSLLLAIFEFASQLSDIGWGPANLTIQQRQIRVTRGSHDRVTPGATRTAPAFRDDEMASAPWSLDRALSRPQCPTLLGRLRPSVVARSPNRICSASALLARPAEQSRRVRHPLGAMPPSTPPRRGQMSVRARRGSRLPYPDGRPASARVGDQHRGPRRPRSRLHGLPA